MKLECCQARVSAKHSREQLATQPGAPKAGSAAPLCKSYIRKKQNWKIAERGGMELLMKSDDIYLRSILLIT